MLNPENKYKDEQQKSSKGKALIMAIDKSGSMAGTPFDSAI